MDEHKTTYSGPSEAKDFSAPLLTMPDGQEGSAELSDYLQAARREIGNLQDQINTFLTQKMADEAAKGVTVDAKEEDLYGEENVEDEG
ncbi:hypothetical protein P152DRAFT_473666 [Eremomyces bilateralis CBS 781.70]|uniref:EKC/KEOPS complex subunit GON7 n=1 Tax=Eremomyces bilateralis CBS 781.70 TaxID=1392243 RepID=A0A6G1G3J3_9PEZI|nr:uncharacterized protein P152DRAFT_473666 [Eremomyces bilateralis CBS 781.70]KAF1812501.1 hypothetical protein P152DRAFT_473666 [Eremomyces bilateralis CBS 781.70]